MCGEHPLGAVNAVGGAGSSPHVRGAPVNPSVPGCEAGIIPACAGSTKRMVFVALRPRDHPRMCGEHVSASRAVNAVLGSSPHVRGAQGCVADLRHRNGIIPACAGSTTDDDYNGTYSTGSSPHVRGAHFENSIIPRKRKDNWLFFIQFRFENFLAFRYLLALLHPFLGVPTKDPSFASLGRLINCNPSQSTGDQSAPYTLKAICCSFLAE